MQGRPEQTEQRAEDLRQPQEEQQAQQDERAESSIVNAWRKGRASTPSEQNHSSLSYRFGFVFGGFSYRVYSFSRRILAVLPHTKRPPRTREDDVVSSDDEANN